jgi:hydroxyacylglutathione hydrolase
MKQLAPGVWRLKQFPAPSVNVYLAEDVLIDAGTRWDRGRIFAEIDGRDLSLLALTHVHQILPGHGPAVTDVAGFERFVASLPS